MSKEHFYDEHIAPKLLELARLCEANGLSFLAVCEYAPGEIGRTRTAQPDASMDFNLTETASRSRGNLDTLFTALAKHAREHGHNSMVLSRMGVPATAQRQGGGQ